MLSKDDNPRPSDILKACAALQKAGADLSEMIIVYEKDDMSKFWIVNKKDISVPEVRLKKIV